MHNMYTISYSSTGRRVLGVAALACVGGLAALTLAPWSILAQVDDTETPAVMEGTADETFTVVPAPVLVEVNSSGDALVRGTVRSIDGTTLALDSWGGTWSVRTDGARVVSGGVTGAAELSSVSVGDYVGVEGAVVAEEGMTIAATFVRNWSTDPYTGADAPAPVSAPVRVLGTSTSAEATTSSADAEESSLDEGTATDTGAAGTEGVGTEDSDMNSDDTGTSWSGIARDIGYRSFIIVDDRGGTYDVSVETETEVLTREGEDAKTIFGLDLEEEVRVDVAGVLETDGTITASLVEVR